MLHDGFDGVWIHDMQPSAAVSIGQDQPVLRAWDLPDSGQGPDDLALSGRALRIVCGARYMQADGTPHERQLRTLSAGAHAVEIAGSKFSHASAAIA